MADTPSTILLTNPEGRTLAVKEALSAGVITPGALIEHNAAASTVVVHSVAQGRNQRIFALENLGDASDIDADYASGETVRYGFFQPGDEVYALVINGTAAILKGLELASDGAGGLVTVTDTADAKPLDGVVVGTALEAVDNSGGSVPVRIRVEVA
ncbi:MAG: hypothetical protein KAJ19_10470 [Gammaproteobacteria bacterium]|nr:hypothetical protein [Gammaproteobacteria bacterium]